MIHSVHEDGTESWTEYDSNGNCIYVKDSIGYEYRCEYDSEGFETYYNNSEGLEIWLYKGKEIRRKFKKTLPDGSIEVTDSDSTGVAISKYAAPGKLTHYKKGDYESWYTYNEQGLCVLSKDSNGKKRVFDYDSTGNLTYIKGPNNFEWSKETGENETENFLQNAISLFSNKRS